MNTAKEILESTNLSKDEIQPYLDTSRPTLLIELDGNEDYKNVGNSRIGGWPDLPKGFNYPAGYDEKLYVFIAQLNLAEVTSKIDINHLPNSGLLYFFLVSDEDNASNIKHLVWYSDDQDLKTFTPRDGYKFYNDLYEKEFPSFKISLKSSTSINSNKFEGDYSNRIEFEGELEKLIYPPSRVGGYSQSSDGDVHGRIIWEKGEYGKYERALISKGHPFIDRNHIEQSNKWIQNQIEDLKTTKSIARRNQKQSLIRDYQQEQKAYKTLIQKKDQLKSEFEKWKLLISIESLDELNMCWWDAGSLEFYINEDDLEIMDFTNTHCIINNAG